MVLRRSRGSRSADRGRQRFSMLEGMLNGHSGVAGGLTGPNKHALRHDLNRCIQFTVCITLSCVVFSSSSLICN